MPDERPGTGNTFVAESARVVIGSDADIVVARQRGRALATQLGFSSGDSILIAMAVSELARNILRYAQTGEIILKAIDAEGKSGVEVMACDRGPGIPDLTLALQDGYSTSGGLGLGLPGVKRLMDQFEITSEMGRGTVISARKFRVGGPQK